MSFTERLREVSKSNQSLLCVGLDPNPELIPEHLGKGAHAVVAFNKAIIRATQDIACAYKPNLGFYVAYGQEGIRALAETRRAIPDHIPAILDAKVADFPYTATAYARGYFEDLGFDAVTANPFLGADSLQPLLSYEGRCVFILAKTSNPGSGDLQDRTLSEGDPPRTLYEQIAHDVNAWQKQFGTCGLVVGATYPAELETIRRIAPDLPLLIPGIGSQQGDLDATVKAALSVGDGPVVISPSRSIIYAGEGLDYIGAVRDAALKTRDAINAARPA